MGQGRLCNWKMNSNAYKFRLCQVGLSIPNKQIKGYLELCSRYLGFPCCVNIISTPECKLLKDSHVITQC